MRSSCPRRRFVGLLVSTMMLALLLFGCSENNVGKKYKFLVLPRDLENEFHSSLVAGAKSSARESGVELEIHALDSEDDYLFQKSHLREALNADDIDGVIITPGDSVKLNGTLMELGEHGIPFVVVDTPLELSSGQHLKYNCGFIGTDNRLGGKIAANYIGKSLGKGKVLLMRGVVSHRTSQDREYGFMEGIKDYPDIEIVHIGEGRWDYKEAQNAIRSIPSEVLSSVDAVFAYNDLMALGIAQAFKDYGHRPLIVGYDGILEAQSAIIEGVIDASVSQAPGAMGQRAVSKLVECIEKKSFGSETDLTHVTLLIATRTLTAVSNYQE